MMNTEVIPLQDMVQHVQHFARQAMSAKSAVPWPEIVLVLLNSCLIIWWFIAMFRQRKFIYEICIEPYMRPQRMTLNREEEAQHHQGGDR